MKKSIAIIMTLMLLLPFFALSVSAVTPIDVNHPSSLTLQYRYNGEPFAGLEIKTYLIASVNADGTYELTGSFKDYPVNIYGIKTQTEWRQVTTTLAAYAIADGIAPDYTQSTDANGTVAFDNILPGMYLTLSVRVEKNKTITLFENFLTAVPHPNDDGSLQYDVTAYPKCEQHQITPEPIEYKIVKQWKDSGNTHVRPESVKIDILRNGEFHSTQTLSAENNWCYRWTSPDDGSKWQAVERDIHDLYTITIEERGTTILITNVYNVPEVPPQTGEASTLWVSILSMFFAGSIMLILAMSRKRGQR